MVSVSKQSRVSLALYGLTALLFLSVAVVSFISNAVDPVYSWATLTAAVVLTVACVILLRKRAVPPRPQA